MLLIEVVNNKRCVTLRKEPTKKTAALANAPLGAKMELSAKSDEISIR